MAQEITPSPVEAVEAINLGGTVPDFSFFGMFFSFFGMFFFFF